MPKSRTLDTILQNLRFLPHLVGREASQAAITDYLFYAIETRTLRDQRI